MRTANNDPEPSGLFVQSFARGLAVIKAFGEDARRLTLTDVAHRSGMTRATARRLLHTLRELGYVTMDGKYFSLTPRILDLGYSYLSSMELWGFAQHYMEDLVERVHESCSVSVLDGHDVVYVSRVPTRRILTSSLNVGSRIPAHAISMGRVQLAALPEEALEHYLGTVQLTRFTPYTVTDAETLRQRIREDGAKGWSLVSRELEEGIAGIAVPLINRAGRTIAAMNLSMQPTRVEQPELLESLLTELRATAEQINSILRMRE